MSSGVNTTNLFVELLVIGVGAAGWLALFVCAALGYDAAFVKKLLSTPAAILPAIVAIYLLGIITDRVADSLLHFLRSERQRLRHFPTEDECLSTRGYVLAKSPYFATQFDYSRSRQRICRGWILNFLLLSVSMNVLLFSRPEVLTRVGNLSAVSSSHLSMVVTPILLLLAAGCWFSWEKLADTELKRTKDQAKLLREIEERRT